MTVGSVWKNSSGNDTSSDVYIDNYALYDVNGLPTSFSRSYGDEDSDNVSYVSFEYGAYSFSSTESGSTMNFALNSAGNVENYSKSYSYGSDQTVYYSVVNTYSNDEKYLATSRIIESRLNNDDGRNVLTTDKLYTITWDGKNIASIKLESTGTYEDEDGTEYEDFGIYSSTYEYYDLLNNTTIDVVAYDLNDSVTLPYVANPFVIAFGFLGINSENLVKRVDIDQPTDDSFEYQYRLYSYLFNDEGFLETLNRTTYYSSGSTLNRTIDIEYW
ncbi:MAG: hypothetical protein SNF93_03420 [Rikenellaceae bacterium]